MAAGISAFKVAKPRAKRVPKDRQRLEALRSGVNIEDWDDHDNDANEVDIVSGVRRILRYQWAGIPDQLNSDFKEHIVKFRNFLPSLVSRSQLYSLFSQQQSLVDKLVAEMVSKKEIIKIVTQNAQVKNDLIMTMDDYVEFLNGQIAAEKTTQHNKALLGKFKSFVLDKETDLSNAVLRGELIKRFTIEEIKKLTELEFLSLVTSDSDRLFVIMPRFGFIVTLYLKAKTFITRTLNATKWKEMPHKELVEKWDKNKARFKDFKGLSLLWALHYLIGEGVIEAFETFDGNAYKVL
ncbi:CYFA0S09e00166g1_1 [Cyberlindnera fabianii]|uniref:CYFA0S09e00166g1_1 n=1 Tax=Cyberlindnera fabianii TaxID=36022 RepID=A0A061AXJ6_CYBFA|nr:CYFA0S09e00166g1_1 [Cyberlindnera fabianii]